MSYSYGDSVAFDHEGKRFEGTVQDYLGDGVYVIEEESGAEFEVEEAAIADSW